MVRKKADMAETKTAEKVVKKETLAHGHKYIYALGRRKTSTARIRLFLKGEGKITVNDKTMEQYFPYFEWQDTIRAPLKHIGKDKEMDVTVRVTGGGIKGQAVAIRAGIARALVKMDEELRKSLKPLGFMKIDPRQKERKKPGLKRARRAPQWQKR